VVESARVDCQKFFEGKPFPFVYTPENLGKRFATVEEVVAWVKEHKNVFDQQAKEYGLVAFRGFPLSEPQHFSAFNRAFEYADCPYLGGGAPRNLIHDNVFTATELAADKVIPPHHEMAYSRILFPSRIFFYCQKPAETNGETVFCYSPLIISKLAERNPAFYEKLKNTEIKYDSVMGAERDVQSPYGRGWKGMFDATTREEAERVAKTLDQTLEWLPPGQPNGAEVIVHYGTFKPFRADPQTGKVAFVNNIIAGYGISDSRNPEGNTYFLDGKSVQKEEAVLDLLAIVNEICVPWKWQAGDVVLVDNHLVMHARYTFTGLRKVLVSLHNNP